ncbi:MAG: Pr6Pr family membrane protein [Verrucomicrobiota bacterium]|nr:Pr6Pr family membrane protein [Verrucomicrobiota bacterium]
MPSILSLTRAGLSTIAVAAIGQQLGVHIGASFSTLNFFSYFTNLSNLFAASVLLLSVFKPPSNLSGSTDLARFVSAVNMVVVGLVFAVLLRNIDLGSLLPWVNIVLHYIIPVAIVLDWSVNPPVTRLNAKHLLLALVFPAIYFGYVLLRGTNTGWYPYPFLNPANVGGYGGVATYSLGIAVTFVLAGWALLTVGNRLASPQQPSVVSVVV